MRIKLGLLEFVDPTPEEVEDLVRKYGGSGEAGASAHETERRSRTSGNGNGAADRAVLQRLLQAGTAGILTMELGQMLSARGKAIPRAMREWAARVGLVSDPEINVFEDVRQEGGRRGVRLGAGFVHVARELESRE